MAQNKNEKLDAALPLLATAALSGAGATDNDLQQLVKQLLQDQLENRNKVKQREERLALNAARAAKDAAEAKATEQSRCSHKRQDDTSRLTGQYLTGTGQLCLVCMFCAKEFHLPPQEGQEAPPRHLIPSADVIGG